MGKSEVCRRRIEKGAMEWLRRMERSRVNKRKTRKVFNMITASTTLRISKFPTKPLLLDMSNLL